MRITDRLISPARLYAVRLGRVRLGRKIYVRGEDQVGIIAPSGRTRPGSWPTASTGIPARASR